VKELVVKPFLILETVGGRGGCVGAVVKHYIPYPGTYRMKRRV